MKASVFPSKFAPALDFIRSGQLDMAQKALEQIRPRSTVEHRLLGHLRGKIQFQKGCYESALHIFTLTTEKYGNHVGLCSDMACCHYLLGNTKSWQKSVHSINRELDLNAQIAISSQIRTRLMLAKFFEELGNLHQAYRVYSKLIEQLQSHPQVHEFTSQIYCQAGRFQSVYGISKNLEMVYRRLLVLLDHEEDPSVQIEISHALMLAEGVLMGAHHGQARMEQVFDEFDLHHSDHKLFYFDWLERALHQSQPLNSTIQSYQPKLKVSDLYQHFISTLAFDLPQFPDFTHYIRHTDQLPFAAALRLHALVIKKSVYSDAITQEIIKKAKLMIHSLDRHSIAYWQHYFGNDVLTESNIAADQGQTQVNQLLLTQSGLATFNHLSLNLNSKPQIKAFLGLFVDREKYGLKELTQSLWQGQYNTSYYHRIRMLVKRVNDLFAKKMELIDLVKLDRAYVQLNSSIQIKWLPKD